MSEVLPPAVPEATAAPEKKAPNPDRYKTLVVILTVLTTVLTAVVAGLQADVNIRASLSNRDSQVNAILVAGELHREGLQSAYDFDVYGSYLKDSEVALVMQITAMEQDQAGNSETSAASLRQADIAQARADLAEKFSVFYTDSRYAPSTSDAMPNMEAYMNDLQASAQDLLLKQNAAADAYNRWNRKGDSYTSVLAILAVAFFLLGLAQALTPRLRLIFAIFGVVAMLGAGLWTLVILIS